MTNSITQNAIIYKDTPCTFIEIGSEKYIWNLETDNFYFTENEKTNLKK